MDKISNSASEKGGRDERLGKKVFKSLKTGVGGAVDLRSSKPYGKTGAR